MDMLQAEFRVVAADEYLWQLKQNKRLPRRSVLITIDDGFENSLRVIHPVMEQRQLPWVLLTTTQALDQPGAVLWFAGLRAVCLYAAGGRIELLGRCWTLEDVPGRLRAWQEMIHWAGQFPAHESLSAAQKLMGTHWSEVSADYAASFCSMLTEDQLCLLAASGLVEIGCQTKTHPFLPCVADARLGEEIDEPTRRLAELLGCPIRTFAYPAGQYGPREIERVAKAGLDCAFALHPVLGRVPRYEIPRSGVYDPSPAVVRAKSLGLDTVLRSMGMKR